MNSIHQNFIDHKEALEADLGEELAISGLCGPLRIFQRPNGHRHSIDDATTSWYALKKYSAAETALDLGSGIGSVGLAVLWGLKESSQLTCVEAQEISHELLKANISCNELGSRVEAIYGDIRELNLGKKFDLITGSPPYFPKHAGVLPQDSQKAHARFELRGHVGDYAKTARRHLKQNGLFVFCFPFQQKERGIGLVEEEGLKIISIKDVKPNKQAPALFSLYSASLDWSLPLIEEAPLIVANEEGGYSSDMLEIQESRGFGDLGQNVIEM